MEYSGIKDNDSIDSLTDILKYLKDLKNNENKIKNQNPLFTYIYDKIGINLSFSNNMKLYIDNKSKLFYYENKLKGDLNALNSKEDYLNYFYLRKIKNYDFKKNTLSSNYISLNKSDLNNPFIEINRIELLNENFITEENFLKSLKFKKLSLKENIYLSVYKDRNGSNDYNNLLFNISKSLKSLDSNDYKTNKDKEQVKDYINTKLKKILNDDQNKELIKDYISEPEKQFNYDDLNKFNDKYNYLLNKLNSLNYNNDDTNSLLKTLNIAKELFEEANHINDEDTKNSINDILDIDISISIENLILNKKQTIQKDIKILKKITKSI